MYSRILIFQWKKPTEIVGWFLTRHGHLRNGFWKDFEKALFFSYLGLITLCRPFIWRRAEKNHDSWVKFKFNLVGNCNCYCIIAKLLGETPTYFLYWASFNFIVKVRQRKSKAFAQITRKALKEYSLLFRNLHWEVFFNTTKLL